VNNEAETFILKNNLEREREVWPLLKFHILRKTHIPDNVTDMEFKSSSYLKNLYALLISLINICIALFNNNKKKVFFGAFTRVKVSKSSINDEFICQKEIGNNFLLYHCSNFESVKILDCLRHGIIFENVIVHLFFNFYKLFTKKKSNLKNFDREFLSILKNHHNLSSDKVELILRDFYIKKNIYSFLIRLLNINEVNVVSSYTKSSVISAAVELNKKVIEHQHGLLAPYHESYTYGGEQVWKSTLLPGWLVIYSSYWYRKMESSNFVVPSKIKVKSRDLIVTKEDDEIIENFCDGREYYIFTGQGLCYDEIVLFIQELLKAEPQKLVVYRPHPREYKNYSVLVDRISNSNFITINRDQLRNTSSLISGALAHISIFSSCHFDAIEILGKTYVLDVVDGNIMSKGGEDDSILFIKHPKHIKLN